MQYLAFTTFFISYSWFCSLVSRSRTRAYRCWKRGIITRFDPRLYLTKNQDPWTPEHHIRFTPPSRPAFWFRSLMIPLRHEVICTASLTPHHSIPLSNKFAVSFLHWFFELDLFPDGNPRTSYSIVTNRELQKQSTSTTRSRHASKSACNRDLARYSLGCVGGEMKINMEHDVDTVTWDSWRGVAWRLEEG